MDPWIAARRNRSEAHFATLHPIPLSRAERIAVLALTGTVVVVAIVSEASRGTLNPVSLVRDTTITLSLAAAVRWPWIPVITLPLLLGLGIPDGSQGGSLFALSLAAFLVLRMGSRVLIATYATVFALALVIVQITTHPALGNFASILGFALAAATCGAIGLLLRIGFVRSEVLTAELTDRDGRIVAARHEERRRIADDLHDVVAHDLVLLTTYAELLDDDSEDKADLAIAIGVAARKALDDLRRAVQHEHSGGAPENIDLPKAFATARRELEAAGRTPVFLGDPSDERLSGLLSATLARTATECVTNTLKYGAHGSVMVALSVTETDVLLEVRNPIALPPARPQPRHHVVIVDHGYGIIRMAERAVALSGTFTAGRDGDEWVALTWLPLR